VSRKTHKTGIRTYYRCNRKRMLEYARKYREAKRHLEVNG
jgi:hypothetical protein